MATYGPAPWQRSRNPRDYSLIRTVAARGAANVYDEDIPDTGRGTPSLVQSQVPAAAQDLVSAPAPGARPARGVGKWLNDIATGYLIRHDPEYMREYPGSWSSGAAYDRDQRGLLNEDDARFGIAGIQQQNRAQESAGSAVDYLRPANQRPYGPPGRGFGALPRREQGTAFITPADARKELPLASNMGWTAKQDFVMSNYPNLFRAAQDAGLTRDEIYDVTNFTLAVDAARTISATVNPQRRQQLLMSMPAPQRALVLDVITAMVSEEGRGDAQITTPAEVAQVNANPALTAQKNAGDEQNWLLQQAREKLWDPSINLGGLPFVYPDTDWGPVEGGELYIGGRGVFDALVKGGEMTMRGVNAAMLSDALGGWENAWNATEAGSFDPEMIRTIKANNDPLLVAVMVDIKKAAASQDDDPIGGLLEKYGNNPQAMAYIDQILLNTDPTSDLSKLAREVDSAETSNLANVGLWSLSTLVGVGADNYADIESYAGSPVFKLGAPTGNVALTFLLDPTIVGTKVNSIRKVAKYGLMESGTQRLATDVGLRGLQTWARIVGNTDVIPALRQARMGLGVLSPGRIDEVFATKGAQTFFNYVGRELDNLRAIDDVGEQAQRFNSFASQNRRWFSPAALKVMMDAGVKDHASAKVFFDDAANMEHMLLGQAGRRTKGYVVPHMTVGYASVKQQLLKARGLTATVMGGKGYLDAVFGPGTAQMMPEEAADHLAKTIEADPTAIGRALSDFAYVDEGGGVRTLTGRIIDRLDRTDRSAPIPDGADPTKWRRRDRYGWLRAGTAEGAFLAARSRDFGEAAAQARASLGRLGRLMAHMPDASRGIPVEGPDGAELVKELAQALGMNRYFANYLRFIWPSMTEPQRVRLVNGLNRTGLVTSGVDLVNPQLAQSLDETFAAVATRTGTQYTASYIDMIRIRANAERVVEQMDRARRAQNKEAMTAAEREAAIQEEVARLADEFVEQAAPPAAPEVVAPVEEAASDLGPVPAPLVDATFDFTRTGEPGFVQTMTLTAKTPDGELIGVLPWDISADADFVENVGKVKGLQVMEKYQRQGVATYLWDMARDYARKNDLPEPQHMPGEQTAAGKAWADAVDARTPAPAAPVDEVTEADVVEAGELSRQEFDRLLGEVMPYSDEGGDIDQAIEDAIVYSEEGDLLNATDALRDAYAAAGLDWPTPAAITPEAEVATAAAWEPYAVPLPDYPNDARELIDFEPGGVILAEEVPGARPDLRIEYTENADGLGTYEVIGERDGVRNQLLVEWDGDVVDGGTPVVSAGTVADQRAAWDFIQRLERTYVLVDTPLVNQVIDDSEEILERLESRPTATPMARITLADVPEGTRTWKRAGGEHTERTVLPRNDMAIVRIDVPGEESRYVAKQPTDGPGDGPEISWYASDGAFLGSTSRGIEDNVVAAMKDAITAWGKENGVKTPTKWSAGKRPRKVDDAAVRGEGGKAKPPLRQGREAAEYIEAEIDGAVIPIRTTVDGSGERTNFGGRFVGDPSLVWRRDTGELVHGPHYTDPEIAEDLYRRALIAADEYDLGTLPTLNQMRETYGDDFGKTLERRVMAEAPDTPTVAGALVNHAPLGRPEMPMSGPISELSFPDRNLPDPGYTSTIQSGKTTKPRAVVVTSNVDAWGVRYWRVEVDRQPGREYGLTADISFDEAGRVQGSAYGLVTRPGQKSPYDASNGYDKRQYALLAKAVVQEAARYDIPIRGQVADWLEQMGAPVVRDPDVWDAEKVIQLMPLEQTNEFAEFALRRNPKLGEKLRGGEHRTYSPLIELGDGSDTIKGFAKINGRNPEIRRLLAEFLGRTDDPPVDTVAQRRVTDPWDGRRYDDRFRPEGRPLGGSTDGLGAETTMPNMVSHHDPVFKEVPGVVETIDGWTFRLRITKSRGRDGEVEYRGIAADISPEGAFERKGWGGITSAMSWHPDGRINVNSPTIDTPTGTGTRTPKIDDAIRRLEEWVTDVAEESGLDIDLPWAGYFPRRGNWWYTGDPVDEAADAVEDPAEAALRIQRMNMRSNWFDSDLPMEVIERPDIVGAGGKKFTITVARATGIDGDPAWTIRAVPEGGSGESTTNIISDKLEISAKGSIPMGGAYKLVYEDGSKSGFYDQGSYKKATWEAIAAALARDGDELGIPIHEGLLGKWMRDMGYARDTFAPIPPTPAPPPPLISDIVQWQPNVTTPEILAKAAPSGTPGRKTKNPIVAVLKNVGDTLPGLQQLIPARGGLWVTDRYRLLRLSDADAEGLIAGRRVIPVGTKARVETGMKSLAQQGLEDTDQYRALEAELQAILDGRPLADIGPAAGDPPKAESLLKGVDDIVEGGTVFTPTRVLEEQKYGRNITRGEMVTDGVVFYNARYVRELPKGAVIKYGKPDKAAAIVDENNELIGMIMPIRMGDGVVDDVPEGMIEHPVHGRQDGWRFDDSEGNTFHFYHHLKEDRASYQRAEDKPKGPIDFGWRLEMRTKGMGPDSPSQAIAIHWQPDGQIFPDAPGGFNEWGRKQPDSVKARMAALADRIIDEQNLPLQKMSERGGVWKESVSKEEAKALAASGVIDGGEAVTAVNTGKLPERLRPAGVAPTKSMKLTKTVYQEFREELGLPAPTRETKTLAYVDLDRDQFTALIDRIQRAGKDADETMTPGAAMAARRKYRDTMQSMWDQGAPDEAAPAPAVEPPAALPALPMSSLKRNMPNTPEDFQGGGWAGMQEEVVEGKDTYVYSIVTDATWPGEIVVTVWRKRKDVWVKQEKRDDGTSFYELYMVDGAVRWDHPTGTWQPGSGSMVIRQNRDNPPTKMSTEKAMRYAEEATERFDLSPWLDANPTELRRELVAARDAERAARAAEREAAEAAPVAEPESAPAAAAEPVETEVVPPPNPIPAAEPAAPEVVEGTVVPPAGAGATPPPPTPPGPPVPPPSPGGPDKVPGLSKGEKRAIRRGEIAQARQNALDNGDIKNPSSLNETDNYALYDPQLTKTVSIIDPAKMNMLMARSSYLNALLGGGPKVTTATDWWTLATLAGPRFVMRSGIEDFALYAITGGEFFGHGGWLDSRRASAAIREATERVEPVGNPLVRGNNPGMKLSLATTARREFGTALAKRIPAFRALVLPYLTEAEVKAASAMAAKGGSEKSREGIANLVATAFARSRFFSANRLNWASGRRISLTGDAKYVSDVIKDGVERGYLNAQMDRASEVAEHLADGTMPAYKAGAGGTEVIDGTTISHVRTQVQGFSTHWQQGGRNADDVESFHMELDRSLHQSGYKSYAAIARSRRYYRLKYEIERAVKPETKAKHQQALDEFIEEFANDIANDPELSRYVLVQELGVNGYAERLLDDAVRMMSTSDGYYNNALLDAMLLPNYRRVTVSNELAEELGFSGSSKADVTQITVNRSQWNDAMNLASDQADVRALEEAGEPIDIYGRNGALLERRYGLYYFDEEGEFRYNLDVEDLHNPDIPMPQSIGAADVITVPVSDKIPWSSRAWAAMGRSLARLTREPIYISNYVDSMRLIEPFKARMFKQLMDGGVGPEEAAEMSGEWAAKTAADRAYSLTMTYVDNPAIRSQLAWQVRNVARFYRALEDFYRRMLRVAQYEPIAFYKAALAWNVLDDSGFVWEDEYGEKYFVFPGTQAMFGAVNGFLSAIGVQSKVPGLPMAWGARVTMLSPSADPNAMVPTLGSPYSGVTIKGLLRFLPSVNALSMEDSQRIEGALFGEYSPQQTFTSSLLNDVAGPNISRILDALGATRGGYNSRQNESDTMYATVSKQSIHALAAAGLIDPSKDYTNEELMEIRSMADATAMNLLYLKAGLTPVLPATPQPISLTVSDEARALGIDSGNALFLEYLNKYGSYEEAFVAFTRDNPGKAIFTVSKYENTAYYRQVVESEDFIRANREEFEARPVGLSHFAPMEGTYSGINGFYFMRANGIKVPITVEDFFNRTMRAAGDAEIAYIDMVEDQEGRGVSPDQRKLVTESAEAMRADVRDEYPMAGLGREIPYDGAKQADRDAKEIATTAKYIVDSGQDKDGRAPKYLDAYDVYLSAKEEKANTGKNSPERRLINESWRSWVIDVGIPMFADDPRGMRYLRTLSTALGTPVEGL